MAANMYRHPTSGELYAYRTDAAGEIAEVAGPIPQRDIDKAVNPVTVLEAWLDNQTSADLEDDAAWLRGEIAKLEEVN